MKIVFFGSSNFALPTLKAITETQHKVLAVITPPDRKSGRGLKLHSTPIKEFSQGKRLYLLQPENPNKDGSFIEELKQMTSDIFVLISYGYILKRSILDIPKLYAINLHPSLLPKYRGAAPINWAIINGDEKTGLSIIKMTGKMDAGPIIYQKEYEVLKGDTSITLNKRLSEKGSEAVIETLALIEAGEIASREQNEKEASFAPKLKKEDARLDFSLAALDLHNKIRGMLDWPIAFTFFNKKKIEILESDYREKLAKSRPSRITEVSKDYIEVATGRGILVVEKVKPEAKKEMTAGDFARGYHLKKGDKFD